MNRALCWDSPAELNWFRLLECNAAVLEFVEQPCTIYYRLDGADHRHIPDSLVRTANSRVLWEVKTAADASKPDVASRTRLMVEQLPHHGYQYSVALAEDLRREPRLSNARLLLRHGRAPLSFEQKEYCRRLLEADVALQWSDVVEGLHTPFSLKLACRLVLEGTLHLNLDQPLDGQVLQLATQLDCQLGNCNG